MEQATKYLDSSGKMDDGKEPVVFGCGRKYSRTMMQMEIKLQ